MKFLNIFFCLQLPCDIKDGRDRPLPLIVNFLRDWYEVRELKELEMAVPEHTLDYYHAAFEKKQFFKISSEARFREGEVQKGKAPEENDLYKEAMKFFQDKEYSKAIQGFKKLLREDPLNGQLLFNLALALQLSGRKKESLEAYENVVMHLGNSKELKNQVQVAKALVKKGGIMLVCENAAEALAIFNTALQTQPDLSPALSGKVIALIKLQQERKYIAFKLMDLLIHDERRLRRVAEIYRDDQNSLTAGLISWIQDQIPISKEKAEDLENAYKTLESVFKGISEAEPALQLLHAARLDALGDRKALLNLPRELRQLIKKNEE